LNVLVRATVIALCLLGGTVVLARSSKTEAVPMREPLANLPLALGAWQGEHVQDLDEKVLGVLGVDEYLLRNYATIGKPPVGLYVGYYQSQRQGDTMHSPLNCLPGAGWLPVQQRRVQVPVTDAQGTRTIEINDFIIEKGLDRQVVLYWYQAHGRVVASEYWGKIYTVVDAVRLNRSDGALVRLTTPVRGSGAAAEQAAEQSAIAFAQQLFPQLVRFLPA
jgi:EpsI family protein